MPQSPSPPSSSSLGRTLSPLSRRRWLVGALALGSAAAAGIYSLAPRRSVPVPSGIVHLSEEEYTFWTRVVEVFLPTAGSGLTPVEQVPVMQNIDEIMGALDPVVKKQLGMGIQLFAYGSIAVGWHGTRFVNLSDEDARDYCDRWLNGNAVQRAIFAAMKQFVYVSYWRDPSTWEPVHYDGPLTRKFNIPRLGNTRSPDA